MATGDVLSCVIDKTGTYAHVKLSALSAGGSYNFGTLPASPTVTFTVTSSAYDNAGNATTTNRIVLGRINPGMPNSGSVSASTVPIGPITGGPFVWGETVTQTGTLKTATVTIGTEGSPLILNNVQAGSNSSGAWVGGTSGASATPTATPSAYSGFPAWEGADGSDLWVRVVFSEPIYSGDTSIKLNTSAGWYTGATATTNFACTNHSSLAYPKCIGQWVTVPAQRFSGALTLEAQCFQHFATGGKPVACVVFTATDGTNTVTQTVTAMTLSTINDSTLTTIPIPTASATTGMVLGETVKQANTNATATVVSVVSGKVVFVNNIVGTPDGSSAWVGQTSAVSITPTDVPAVANRVSVYACTINASSFNQSATVTYNFKAYPWIGDSSAVLDTSTGPAWAIDQTNALGPRTALADKGNSYGVTTCYVDQTSTFTTNSAVNTLVQDEVGTQATSGATAVFNWATAGSPNSITVTEITGTPNNSNNWTFATSGTVITPLTAPTANGNNSTAVVNDPNHPCATDINAAAKIAAYNLANFGHNNCDAGIIYYKKGRIVFGSFNSGVAAPNVWCTFTRAPGTTTNDVRMICKGATNYVVQQLQRFYDLDVYMPNSGNAFMAGGYKATWVDSCRIVGGTATQGVIDSGFTTLFTNNAAVNVSGWAGFGNQGKPSLVRGNAIQKSAGFPSVACATGNTACTGNPAGIIDGGVYSFNQGYSCVGTGNPIFQVQGVTSGVAIVGNLIEVTGGTQPAVTMDDDSTGGANIIYWHNTIVGERNNSFYNWTATADLKNLSVKYWSCGFWFTKHDRGPETNNPTYNKGWQAAYGVGFLNGNQTGDPSTVPASYFYKEPIGFASNTASNFVNNKGQSTYDSQGQGGGNGDYHPAANSVLRGKVTDPVIPFDLAGTAISVGGSAGALQPLPSPSGGGSGAAAAALEFFGMI